jgi:4-hydroxybenzoate polyprenyltransferase
MAAPDTVRAGDWLALLRPLHWVKSVVVLAPLVFAGRLLDLPSLRLSLLAAAAFCLLASAGYVLNDLHDAAFDRHHPLKSGRPLARGGVARGGAVALLLACLAGGLLLAAWLERLAPPPAAGGLLRAGPLAWCLVYVALTALYTLLLKRLVVLDVIALALGFLLRAGAGSAALQLAPSRWLLICGFCLALFLAAGKRRLELAQLGRASAQTRPMLAAYTPASLDALVDGSALLCVGSYVAYGAAPDTVAHVGSRALLLTAPLVALLVWRHRRRLRRGEGRDPVEMLLSDPASIAGFLLWTAGVLLVIYRPW